MQAHRTFLFFFSVVVNGRCDLVDIKTCEHVNGDPRVTKEPHPPIISLAAQVAAASHISVWYTIWGA